MDSNIQVTASQIAQALGVTKRAILKRLAMVPHKVTYQRGQASKSFDWASLPSQLREQLAAAARKHGHTSAIEWLHPSDVISAGNGQNPIKVEMPGDFGKHACLDDCIATINDKGAPTLEDRAFLLDRAFRHWERLREDCPQDSLADKKTLLIYLRDQVPGLCRQRDTRDGEVKAWNAMRELFRCNYDRWVAGGRKLDALTHQGKGRAGRKCRLCSECRELLNDTAIAFKGNMAITYRELRRNGMLCAECMNYHYDPRVNKSYVPKTVMRRSKPNKLQLAAPKGRRAFDQAGAKVNRDWSDEKAGNWFSSDDLTLNQLAWSETRDGIVYGHPQMIHVHDMLSGYPLDFLVYFGHPTGLDIQRAMARVLKRWLPRRGLYLERGAYKSRHVVGDKRSRDWLSDRYLLPFRDTESALLNIGLRFMDHDCADAYRIEFGLNDPLIGLKIKHARVPQTKTIEGDFNSIQQRARILPGEAGNNERLEGDRNLQDFIRRVKSGKEHPGNEWLNLSEIARNYAKFWEEYAHTPMNGIRHRGMAPAELWRKDTELLPLTQLPKELHWTVATHRKTVRLSESGIVIRGPHNERFTYADHATGQMLNAYGCVNLLVFINIEEPGVIHVQDPKTKSIITVRRAVLSATSATRDELEVVLGGCRAHNKAALGDRVFGDIKHAFSNTIIRDCLHPDSAKVIGAQVNRGVEAHVAKLAEEAPAQALRQKLAKRLGKRPGEIKDPKRVQEAIERAEAAKARERARLGGNPV